MPYSLQVTSWSPDTWDFIITMFLTWDCKGDESDNRSEDNPVLLRDRKAERVRGPLSTDLGEKHTPASSGLHTAPVFY